MSLVARLAYYQAMLDAWPFCFPACLSGLLLRAGDWVVKNKKTDTGQSGNATSYEELVRKWLQDIVIEYNFCPFAKKPYQLGEVRLVVCHPGKDSISSQEGFLQQFLAELRRLDREPSTETTLLVVPNGLESFDDYLGMLDALNELLVSEGYEGVYQLASFHPDYVFDGCAEDDAANYTNRSPLPLFHLIREDSLEKAIATYGDTANIPEDNIKLTRDKGADYWADLLMAFQKLP